MTVHELARAMHAMADRLEDADLPESLDFRCDVATHRVENLDDLRAVARLMNRIEADKGDTTHWITSGTFPGEIRVTAFYKAGLLGKTKTKTVKVVETEDATDVSVLTTR